MAKKAAWYYFRKGWTTCTKASKFLEASKIDILDTVMASKKLQASDAEALLKNATKLIAMKGKKVQEFDVSAKVGSDAVEAMLGPTGNMRAPTVKVGNTYLVGFNEEVFNLEFGWEASKEYLRRTSNQSSRTDSCKCKPVA